MEKITIGKMAVRVGTKVSTIRFYQRSGLLEEPPKVNGGFRYYTVSHVGRLKLILNAKSLGFSLEEVRQLIRAGRERCDIIRGLLKNRIDRVEAEIANLDTARQTLSGLLQTCETELPDRACPAIGRLESI